MLSRPLAFAAGRRMPVGATLSWLAALLLVVRAPSACPADDEPIFELSFDGPRTVAASPGTVFQREFLALLTTRDNPDPNRGAQGWSISLTSDGVDIVNITTKGTIAATTEDDPPGLRDPEHSFELSELGQSLHTSGPCEGRVGAVGAVVLDMNQSPQPVTLPAEGTVTIARLIVQGTAPASPGQVSTAAIYFLDGCAGSG
jgi:hypothetical protein